MAIRIALFLLIGLGFSGLAATIIMSMSSPTTTSASVREVEVLPVAKTPILVAAHELRGGTLLVAEDVTTLEVPVDAVPAGAWPDSLDTRSVVRGAMIRNGVAQGAPVLKADIVRPGDRGFLAAVLGPNMRAASVAVDAVSGAAGLIWPGDRVDVLLTQKMDDTKVAARSVSGETVLENIRVIAVDKHMAEGEPPDANITASINQRTVTLEVSSKDAQKLSVAGTLGHLMLIIRSASDTASPHSDASKPVVWSSDVSAAYRIGPDASPTQTVRLFGGAQAAPVEFHY